MATQRFVSKTDLHNVLLADGSGPAIDIEKGTLVMAETDMEKMAKPSAERTFTILTGPHTSKVCKVIPGTFRHIFKRVY